MRFAILVAASLALTPIGAAPAWSQGPLDGITDAEDRKLLPEAAELFGVRDPDLAAVDALLKKLPRPTRLRAVAQMMRSGLLLNADRNHEAIDAAEEALRILPDETWPKFNGFYIMTFGGAPQRAADLWIAASIQSPEAARGIRVYILATLEDRLRAIGDHGRADRLMARVSEIGMVERNIDVRSAAALAGIRAKVTAGDIDAARGLVAQLAASSDMRSLYIDRRYERIWPAIEAWGGKNLETQERSYLEQLRSEWQAGHDFEAGAAYARGLRRVGAFQAVVDIFGPHLAPEKLTRSVDQMEILAISLSASLTALGRTQEAVAMLKRVAALLPEDDGFEALNIWAAIAEAQLAQGQAGEAVDTAAAWRARAREIGAEINHDAVVGMALFRACALIEAGRAAEAGADIADVILARNAMPAYALRLYACQNDVAKARTLILDHLPLEATRGWALSELQPQVEHGVTRRQKTFEAFQRALQADPELRTAAAKVGRIMVEPIGKGLPAGFVPDEAAARAPQSPDSI